MKVETKTEISHQRVANEREKHLNVGRVLMHDRACLGPLATKSAVSRGAGTKQPA